MTRQQEAGAADAAPGRSAEAIRRALARWFKAHARDLPWRRGYDPYHVLVSEFMLQQTQMDRAVAYFERFVRRFPDLDSLAAAAEDEVLKLWEGLGYYSRARNLHTLARSLARTGGRVPSGRAELLALPGIGTYTAGAVLSVAFDRPEPAVDANVARIFARLLNLELPLQSQRARAAIDGLARALVPAAGARVHNQALMELGALVCLPRSPRCGDCPLAAWCESLRLGTVLLRPAPKPGKEIKRIEMASGVLVRRGRVYIQKRRLDDVWPGLWEFPGGVLAGGETPEQAVVREFAEETGLRIDPVRRLDTVRYSYTRYRVTQHPFVCRDHARAGVPRLLAAMEGRFVSLGELSSFAFPSGHRKVADRLRSEPHLIDFP